MKRFNTSPSLSSVSVRPIITWMAGAIFLSCLTGCSIFSGGANSMPSSYWVYFSSNKVIEVAKFDTATGQISTPVVTSQVLGTNWLSVDPTWRYMYATAAFEGRNANSDDAGAAAAFSIDRSTGMLTLLNRQPTHGGDPAHINVDPTARVAIASNYAGGNITAYPIGSDGKLGEPLVTQHSGSSTDPVRQTKPYPHSTMFDPTGRFAYVQDLGTDKINIYNVDAKTAKLTPHDPAFVSVPGGNGPRHLAFDAAFKHAYLVTEMGKNIFVFDVDAATGNLTQKQQISCLSPDFKDAHTTAAEAIVAPGGKFLYATVRDLDAGDSHDGKGTIATFAIDPAAGTLTSLGWVSSNGMIPRSFAIDPTGHWLFCGNQNSGTIVQYKINTDTGALTPTDLTIKLDSPFCEVFVPMQK